MFSFHKLGLSSSHFFLCFRGVAPHQPYQKSLKRRIGSASPPMHIFSLANFQRQRSHLGCVGPGLGRAQEKRWWGATLYAMVKCRHSHGRHGLLIDDFPVENIETSIFEGVFIDWDKRSKHVNSRYCWWTIMNIFASAISNTRWIVQLFRSIALAVVHIFFCISFLNYPWDMSMFNNRRYAAGYILTGQKQLLRWTIYFCCTCFLVLQRWR